MVRVKQCLVEDGMNSCFYPSQGQFELVRRPADLSHDFQGSVTQVVQLLHLPSRVDVPRVEKDKVSWLVLWCFLVLLVTGVFHPLGCQLQTGLGLFVKFLCQRRSTPAE